jgi:death-on-curing protein
VTIYMSTNDVQMINKRLCGPNQLRDFGLLDTAVSRPLQSAFGDDAYPTIHEKAAALLHGLARFHPFVTGNKRTAWMATAMFYMVNGYSLHAEAGAVVGLTGDAAEGVLGVADIAAILKGWAQPFDTNDGDDGDSHQRDFVLSH